MTGWSRISTALAENKGITMAFEPGKSGNPGGRPKENNEVKRLARTHAVDALNRLVELMASEDERIAVSASNSVLDRAFGKPAQAIVGGDDDDNPISFQEIVIRAVDAASR